MRWFYSSIVEGTYVTPANLYHALCAKGSKGLQAPALRVTKARQQLFDFVPIEYTLESHPARRDLLTLLNACCPALTLLPRDLVDSGFAKDITRKLSIWDPEYLHFLIQVAIRLGLLRKMPSIHASVATVPEKSLASFASLGGEEAFAAIVKAAMSFSVDMLRTWPWTNPGLRPESLSNTLAKPTSLDDVRTMVMERERWDFDDLDDDREPWGNDMRRLGRLLDRFFITPMGYYLQLIRPMFRLPFDLDNEFDCISDIYGDSDCSLTELFIPATMYVPTKLGAEFFGSKPFDDEQASLAQSGKDEIVDLIEKVAKGAPKDLEPVRSKYSLMKNASMIVYAIKCKPAGDNALWKTIEVIGSSTLSSFFNEICYEFSLDPSSEYSYCMSADGNPFSEYTCALNPRKAKKVETTTLDMLNLLEKQKFTLRVIATDSPFFDTGYNYLPYDLQMKLQVSKIKAREDGTSYPHVARKSSAFYDIDND
jgi:hypothetical protein